MLRLGIALLAGALALNGPAVTSPGAHATGAHLAPSEAGRRTAAAADDRIVWDAKRHGVRLFSARTDGTDRVLLWKQQKGDVLNLDLSPRGDRVAFSPDTKRGRSARLVVVPVAGGDPIDLLPRRSEIEYVGPVGWSPNGRRLVFEGAVDEPSAGDLFYPSYLFSVSSDGGDLRKGRLVSDGSDNGAVFGSILVTRDAIFYPGDDSIIRFPSLRGGRAEVIARRSWDVRPSGNGRWLFFRHITASGAQSLRKVRPNGEGQRLVLRYPDLYDIPLSYAPDTTGRRVLMSRQDPDVRVGYESVVIDTRTGTAEELPFARGTSNRTW